MRDRSIKLDLLRILAALWVLSYHWSGRGSFYETLSHKYSLEWWPNLLDSIAQTGLLGVDVFFILSGAVIAKTSLYSTPSKFIEKRFLRLFPVYFVSTLIALVLVSIATNKEIEIEDLLSLSGLQFWVGGRTLIEAAWTLPIEIMFYFVVYLALQFSFFRKCEFDGKQIRRLTSIWLVVIVLAPQLELDALSYLANPQFAPYFILGVSLSQASNLATLKKNIFIISVALALSMREFTSRVPEIHNRQVFGLTLMSSIVIVIVLSNIKHKFMIPNPISDSIKTLSLMTYPVYLLHETIGMSLISILNKNGMGILSSHLLILLTIFLMSLRLVKDIEPMFKKMIRAIL